MTLRRFCFTLTLFFLMLRTAHAGAGHLSPPSGSTPALMDFEVNFRFPPTRAQIDEAEDAVRKASEILCDATDGQVSFGTVRLTGGAVDEDKADVWLMTEPGRSFVTTNPQGRNLGTLGRRIILFRNAVDGPTLAHEMSHHAFGLGDEYKEDRRFGGGCGIGWSVDPGMTDEQNNTLMQDLSATEYTVASNHDRLRGDNVLCPVPVAATRLDVEARLPSGSPLGAFDGTSFDTAQATSALVGMAEVIDSKGAVQNDPGGHTLWLFFEHTGTRAWRLHFGLDAGDIGGTPKSLALAGTVDLTFNANGSLATLIPASPKLDVKGLSSGAADLTLTVNLGTPGNFDGVVEDTFGVVELAASNGFPLCKDAKCSTVWNSTTKGWETCNQTLFHGGLSDWETLHENYSFLNAPAGLPTAAPPASCKRPVSFVEDVTATDQILLVIDRSGSMSTPVAKGSSQTRLDFAKAAARAFVDLQANGGTQMGLVSFEETPTLDRRLLDLKPADATPLKAVIDKLKAGGNTGIGTAMTASQFELDSAMITGRTRTLFLLSDGQNNRGEDPIKAAQRLKDRGVRIFTVPVGSDADRTLLSNVAGLTNAVMLDAPSGDELPAIYAELSARFRGETLVLPRTRSAVAGRREGPGGGTGSLPDHEEFPFQVEAGAQRLNVMLSARNLDVRTWGPGFRLLGPAGEIFTEADVKLIASDPFYRIVRISGPTPGTWRLQVSAPSVRDQFSYVLAHVENPAPDLLIDAQPRIARPGRPVTLSAALTYGADLEGAVSYSGIVRRPDGSTVPLAFQFDPLGRTVTADFAAFAGRGIYEVVVRGDAAAGARVMRGESLFSGPAGTATVVEPFTRFARTSFFLDTTELPPCGNDCESGVPTVPEP
jgi:hypothetical protein